MSTGSAGATIGRVERLDPEAVTEVLSLVDRATSADGVAPLSEHVLLHLRRGGEEPGRHLLLREGGTVVGYAHLDPTDVVEGPSAELVVDPEQRRRGHGRRLVTELLDIAGALPNPRLRLWAHGEAPDAGSLAATMGFDRERELWQMRRSLFAALPPLELPEGVSLRTFRPGDEDEVLALNAEAFAEHPEQGRWTRSDLDARVAESWFDPEGLFLAHGRDGRLLAFHWTKVHGGTTHSHGSAGEQAEHAHEAIGEVYVVGVSPQAQGRGLGRAMTLAGLRHLRSLGLNQVMLYVDADNTGAVRTYSALGFSRWDVDVQFRRHG